MGDGDLRDQILRLEAHINELTKVIESCRKVMTTFPEFHRNGVDRSRLNLCRGAHTMDPKVLRQHSRDCKRLVQECSDLFSKQALLELATEFTKAADALESDLREDAKRITRSERTRAHG